MIESPVILTNVSGIHTTAIGEFVLQLMLMFVKQAPLCFQLKRENLLRAGNRLGASCGLHFRTDLIFNSVRNGTEWVGLSIPRGIKGGGVDSQISKKKEIFTL